MLNIDYTWLEEIGLGALANDEKDRMIKHIYETLEMRVGMSLAAQMSEAQLDEFEQLANARNDSGALTWLETNFPNYKQVVAAEFNKLEQEIMADKDAILAAAQSDLAHE